MPEKETPPGTTDGGKTPNCEATIQNLLPELNGKTPLEAALAYAKNGIPVFPCKPDKRPYTENGFKDASTSEQLIRAWWKRWPDALIGMPTGAASGLLVLDVDLPHGPQSLAALESKHVLLPKTVEAKTRSGGRHIYFQHVPGIRCSTGKLGPGLDVRAEGGYVIAPPSPGYSWEGSKCLSL